MDPANTYIQQNVFYKYFKCIFNGPKTENKIYSFVNKTNVKEIQSKNETDNFHHLYIYIFYDLPIL